MSDREKLFPTKFPGYYVSRSGKIYREPNKKDNTKELVEVGQHLRGGIHTRQYKAVSISLKDERGKYLKQIKYYSHRLIAETLINNPHNLTEVNHIDEDKLNNSVDNLEWISHRDNFLHSPPQRNSQGHWLPGGLWDLIEKLPELKKTAKHGIIEELLGGTECE